MGRGFADELSLHLRARCGLIVVVTPEEERALDVIAQVARDRKRRALRWDVADGFTAVDRNDRASTPSADDALTAIERVEREGDGIFVLLDFHERLDDDVRIRRKLRSVAQGLKYTSKSIIWLSPVRRVPVELQDECVVLEMPLPDARELAGVLSNLLDGQRAKRALPGQVEEKLVQAALGMSSAQAHRAYAKSFVSDGMLDDRHIDQITQEKKEIIRESEALEFYAVTETENDIGGLDVLKDWLRLRERAFGQQARDYGLPAPKGIALIGIPGTGKSLTAKMVGGLWQLPLLRLDVGALFGSLVGEAEERTRRALRLAETVAPCVVWIDEMEKALAHGGGDSGTSTRVFGSILTWMQEKTAPCFVVGTANDISSLPPEVLRKGRFDEIFFLDLPTQEERVEIFEVHLRKRKRGPDRYDLSDLATRAGGYVGAEIEQAIIDAMYVGFNEEREFTTADIADALDRQVPLSVSQRETITSLRAWLGEGRAQSASFHEVREARERFVPLEVDPGVQG